jgi:hypothetical protein
MDADLPSFNADPDLDSVFSQKFGSGSWGLFFSFNSEFFRQENLLLFSSITEIS